GRRISAWIILLSAFLLGPRPAGAQLRITALPTSDLVSNRVTGKLYASVPSRAGAIGNSVTEIDPASGKIGRSIFVCSEPGKLALSDDGRFLYVGLDGSGSVSRIDLTQGKVDLQFPLGTDQLFLVRVDLGMPFDLSLTLQPSTLVGGRASTGTVTLSRAAPA